MTCEEYQRILDLVSGHQSVVSCCDLNRLSDELLHLYKQQKNETDRKKIGMSETVVRRFTVCLSVIRIYLKICV